MPLLATGVLLPFAKEDSVLKRASLLLALACLAAGTTWAADDPMVGDWRLNPQKSRLIDEMKVTSLGGNKYTFDFGGPSTETIAVDGTDQPGIAGTTLSVTAVSSEEWRVVRKKDDRVEITGIWTLSKDGNMLHDDYTEIGENGKTFHLVYLYDRKGGGPRFAGDWVSTSQEVETAYVLQVRPYGGDGLSIIVPSEGVTKNVEFDGKDYPDPDSKRGVVSSAKRVNERTVELTAKIGGKLVDTREVSVSEDGKTLTMTVHPQGRSVPDVLEFDRTSEQSFPLADTSGLSLVGGKAESVEYLGRKAVCLTTQANSDIFAYVNGSFIRDGDIEVDIAVKITTPPGVRMPGFTGLAFRARPDGSAYDMFYLRPRNAQSDDQAMRNHSVQYVAKPGYDWYPLRRQWPWIYESWADLKPETWTHVKVEIRGRSARLFLNGSDSPSLDVNGLKGEDLQGGVALWGYPGEESYFSNLRITPVDPLPIQNGGEARGNWHVVFASDYGRYEGELSLHRDGKAITGTWIGAFGKGLAVSGTWRDGYLELAFTGNWQEDPSSTPVPAAVTLAGWVDNDTATGRMKVEGHADGQWTAARQE
jgi:hypothetical protein